MKLNKTNTKILDSVYRIINNSMSINNKYKRNNEDIERKSKKYFRPNKVISFKDIFETKEYSNPNYYNDYLDYLRNPENAFTLPNEQVNFLNILNFEMAVDPETFERNITNLIESLFWASESLKDFRDTFYVFMEAKQYKGNLVKYKMLFKEFYSLIDRLRVEASIEISTKNMGLSRDADDLESRRFTRKWRERMPQDTIINGDPTKLSKSIAYIKNFEVDDEGWVTFEYGDMDSILSPYKNELFKIIRESRNFNEHSASNYYTEQYYESGQLNRGDSPEEKYHKLCEIFKGKCYLVMIIYFYHLFEISKVHGNLLFN